MPSPDWRAYWLDIKTISATPMVEAIEVPGHPVLGVQWHPEWMKSADPTLTWVVREAARLLERSDA